MTIDEKVEVLRAYQAGKEIEIRRKVVFGDPWNGEWHDCEPSEWNFAAYDYRIKSKPREPREWTVPLHILDEWIIELGSVPGRFESEGIYTTGPNWIRVREVL